MAVDYQILADKVFRAVQQYIDKQLGLDLEILRSLQARVGELEAASPMVFAGPHVPKIYPAGSVVQRSGSTWIALAKTADVPGASTSWRRLASDRDAR